MTDKPTTTDKPTALREVPDILSEKDAVNLDSLYLLQEFTKKVEDGTIQEVVLIGINNETHLVQTKASQTLNLTYRLGAIEVAKAMLLDRLRDVSIDID